MTSPADGDGGRLANLVGAWALAVADRIQEATADAAARGAQAPAALVALREFSNGRPIEQLRSVLGLSHSATVRLVDTLEAAGLVTRGRVAADRRAIAVMLTPTGRRRADAVERARRRAVAATLAGLSASERRQLERTLEHLIADVTSLRLQERADGTPPASGWLCRLCDFDACGRDRGACPAASTALATGP